MNIVQDQVPPNTSDIIPCEPICEPIPISYPVICETDQETESILAGQTRVLPPRQNRGKPPAWYSPSKLSKGTKYPVKSAKGLLASVWDVEIPRTVDEAINQPEWYMAMKEEINALYKNNTWEKVQLPKGKRLVGCRWVYTVKYKADRNIERYKARLVARGYTQTYGIDYSETFSPVAQLDTIRVLFSVAVTQSWPLQQYDVKNAFLHGELKEKVYMSVSPGFSEAFAKNEVCRLRRSLYGLKQSPRAWFGRFTTFMKKQDYKQSNSDHTLFIKRKGPKVTCLIIYVDDMIITGDDNKEMDGLKQQLFSKFEMKDLEDLRYFLGIEVRRSEEEIFISQ